MNTVCFAHARQETYVRIYDNTSRIIGICLTRRCCAVQQTDLRTTDVNYSCNRSGMGCLLDRPSSMLIKLAETEVTKDMGHII